MIVAWDRLPKSSEQGPADAIPLGDAHELVRHRVFGEQLRVRFVHEKGVPEEIPGKIPSVLLVFGRPRFGAQVPEKPSMDSAFGGFELEPANGLEPLTC